ncbi:MULTISPECIES: hypothetical protein [unclassified Bradyrhizobium]|nr:MULTISPECIES: hypothetical protein [unclassified Bradyrhizobium]
MATNDELRFALEDLLAAEKDFRDTLPANWEGDPLHYACGKARKLLTE